MTSGPSLVSDPVATSYLSSKNDPSLLVVVVDINHRFINKDPHHWINKDTLSCSLVAFFSAFGLLHRRNEAALVACSASKSALAYPISSEDTDSSLESLGNVVGNHLLSNYSVLNTDHHTISPFSCISAGLSTALCYINRRLQSNPSLKSRILVLQSSDDSASQYISIMNSIFCSQKLSVIVDACFLTNESSNQSPFLQQACSVTGGIYARADASSLLPVLFTYFLPDHYARQHLNLPNNSSVDNRAACFCHGRSVDLAVLCSVCLSVFCDEGRRALHGVCCTCGSRMKRRRIK